MFHDVTTDEGHRQLAAAMIRAACETQNVTVGEVAFGEREQDAPYSWVCYVIDPRADDRRAEPLSVQSARDHYFVAPNARFHWNVNESLRAVVYEIEVGDEATVLLRDRGPNQVIPYSPWIADLAVARVHFNYGEG